MIKFTFQKILSERKMDSGPRADNNEKHVFPFFVSVFLLKIVLEIEDWKC
jgi:hypothetical protein